VPITTARHRLATWLAWWVLMMGLWVAVDDSFQFDELLAGAAAALAALAAELVTHQAEVRLRLRPRWLLAALRLPWQVARDTGVVFGALARLLLRRERLDSEFAEIPVRYGDDTPLGQTRRVLLIGARSLAPNTFVLGMDPERDTMIVHRLVTRRGPGR
jgi:multisubunit Na+/H+ antiporter MnhE subunit